MVSKCNLIIFIITILVETFDLVCDWLLYHEVSGLKEGLVFGPFSDAVVYSLLLFCVLGSVLYSIELIMNCFAHQDENGSLDWSLDVVNCVSIWFEDVPQILLNVYIAGCREEAISILQMAKAIAAIVEVLTNIVLIIAKRCYNRYEEIEPLKVPGKCLQTLIGIGLTIMLLGSVAVFMLTNFTLDSKNVITFSSPQTFNDGQFETEKYFSRSSVFLNFGADQGNIVTMTSDEWIKLAHLTDITAGKTVVVTVKYNSSPNTRLWIQSSTSTDLTSAETSTCYNTQTTPFPVVTACSTDLPVTAATRSMVFKFVYQSSEARIPLGDIYYNYKIYQGNCAATSENPAFSLSYFKVISTASDAEPLQSVTSLTGSYYSPGKALQDTSEAWKTGKFGCEPTGRTAPKQDKSITVPCLSWT